MSLDKRESTACPIQQRSILYSSCCSVTALVEHLFVLVTERVVVSMHASISLVNSAMTVVFRDVIIKNKYVLNAKHYEYIIICPRTRDDVSDTSSTGLARVCKSD